MLSFLTLRERTPLIQALTPSIDGQNCGRSARGICGVYRRVTKSMLMTYLHDSLEETLR